MPNLNLPWLIVLDAGPVHVAVDFRKCLYTDLPWEQCAKSSAAEIMLTLRSGGGFRFDAGLVGSRLRLPNWIEVAMTKTLSPWPELICATKNWISDLFLQRPISSRKHRTWQAKACKPLVVLEGTWSGATTIGPLKKQLRKNKLTRM
eukprot:1177061-Amphidinium_carterae.1